MLKNLFDLKRYRKTIKGKRGMTMFQLLVIIIVIIVLGVVFSDMNLIKKINRGKETAAWSTELSTLTNSVLSAKDMSEMLYTTRIRNGSSFDLMVSAPNVSAYDAVNTYTVDTLTLNYSSDSKVSLGSGGTGFTLSPSSLPNIAYSGSRGIAPFVNLSVAGIEESLFLGLMGGNNSQIGKYYEDKGKLPLTKAGGGKATIKDLLKITFDSGTTKDFNQEAPSSLVSLKPMNTEAVKELIGGSYKFYNTDKYRLYWVSSVVTENEAVALLTDPAKGFSVDSSALNGATMVEVAKDTYDKLIGRITADTIIAMPNSKSSAVYSETSDFSLYKFTTTD